MKNPTHAEKKFSNITFKKIFSPSLIIIIIFFTSFLKILAYFDEQAALEKISRGDLISLEEGSRYLMSGNEELRLAYAKYVKNYKGKELVLCIITDGTYLIEEGKVSSSAFVIAGQVYLQPNNVLVVSKFSNWSQNIGLTTTQELMRAEEIIKQTHEFKILKNIFGEDKVVLF